MDEQTRRQVKPRHVAVGGEVLTPAMRRRFAKVSVRQSITATAATSSTSSRGNARRPASCTPATTG
jgi:hypothetical protein